MPRSTSLNRLAPKISKRKAGLILWAGVATIALANLGTAIGNRYQFALNETESLPNWAFFIDKTQKVPSRDQYYEFVAPPNPYYPAGFRFTKRVAGQPGDVVTVKGREFFINGRSVGTAKPADKAGHPAVMSGPGIIPSGHYFMVTPSKDSLDSRYALIGLIEASRLVGRAYPVM